MMDAYTPFKQWQHHCNLRELFILVCQCVDGIIKNFTNAVTLVLIVKITILEGHAVGLALTLAKTKHNAGLKVLTDNQCY